MYELVGLVEIPKAPSPAFVVLTLPLAEVDANDGVTDLCGTGLNQTSCSTNIGTTLSTAVE